MFTYLNVDVDFSKLYLKINCLKLHKTKSERKGEIYPHKKLLRDPPPSSLHELRFSRISEYKRIWTLMHSNFPSIWGESKNRKYFNAMGPEGGWEGGLLQKNCSTPKPHICTNVIKFTTFTCCLVVQFSPCTVNDPNTLPPYPCPYKPFKGSVRDFGKGVSIYFC